jgi:hypothetical protein
MTGPFTAALDFAENVARKYEQAAPQECLPCVPIPRPMLCESGLTCVGKLFNVPFLDVRLDFSIALDLLTDAFFILHLESCQACLLDGGRVEMAPYLASSFLE